MRLRTTTSLRRTEEQHYLAVMAFAGQVLQKLKIEPPPKFTGKEDYERWFKRLTNYLSLSDENYRVIIEAIANHPKTPILPVPHYGDMEQNYGLGSRHCLCHE